MRVFYRFLLFVLLLHLSSINSPAQDALEFYAKNKDGSVEHVVEENVDRFYIQKHKGQISSMRIKDESGWYVFPLDHIFGYTHYPQGSDEPETYRFVKKQKHGLNGGKVMLMDGNVDGDAIYRDKFFLYLIYVAVWDFTYYLQHDGEFFELKSKEQLARVVDNTCLTRKLRNSERSLTYLASTSEKSKEGTLLLQYLQQCGE